MPSENPAAARSRADLFSARSISQLTFLAAGSAFFLTSIAVTRRSIARMRLSAMPKFYHPNNRIAGNPLSSSAASASAPTSTSAAATAAEAANVQGGLVAVQALGLATLNVFSFALFAVGGARYALDVSTMEDLRAFAKRTMNGPSGERNEEAERELEEWAANGLIKLGKWPEGKEARKKDEKEDR